jgi:hypothetical protein
LKKRSKKLLRLGTRIPDHLAKGIKVFWFFFSKKNCFLRRGKPVARLVPAERTIGHERATQLVVSRRALAQELAAE